MKQSLNWVIITAVLILALFSLALIQSVAPEFFASQLIYFCLGFCLLLLVSRIDYQILIGFGWYFWGLAVLVLLLTLGLAQVTRSTARWIYVGSLSFQPSELVKPLLILAFGSFFAQNKPSWQNLGLSLVQLAVPAGLVFIQPDLGSALLFFFIWLAGSLIWLDKRKLALLLVCLLAVSIFGWGFLKDYQKDRLSSFLHPTSDPLGSGYHLIQAKIAAGSGQLFGRGLLRGTQSHLRFLPERHSDFVFASLAEELGFVGSLMVLTVYFFLLAQLLRCCHQTDQPFGLYLCLGVFGMIFSQVIVNVGMNIGLMPITGITLPFLSTGGSSIIGLMIGLGLVESVARFSRRGGFLQIR